MPTIPSVNVGGVAPAIAPGPIFQSAGAGGDPDTFGAGIARADAAFARQTQAQADQLHNQIMDELQTEAETMAKEAQAAVHKRRTKILYGDPDDPTAAPGHYTLSGAAQLANAATARQLLEDADSEVGAQLQGNPEAMRIYKDQMLFRNSQLARDMGLTDSKARKVAAQASYDAMVTQAQSEAADGYTDDQKVRTQVSIASSQTYLKMIDQGATHEAASVAEAGGRALAVTAAVKAAIADGDNARAEAIMAQYEDALDPQGNPLVDQNAMTSLRATLNVSNDKAVIGEAVSRIAAEAPGDLKAQLKLVEDLPADQREPARQHLRRMDNDRDEAEKEYLEDLGGEAFSAMDDGQSYEEWARVNPEKADLLDRNPTWSKAIQAKRKLLAKGRLFAEFTDGVTFTELSRAVAEGRVLSQAQINASAGFLTQGNHAQLNSLNNALIARNAAAAGKTGDKVDKLIAASDKASTAVAPISLHGAAHAVAVKGIVFEKAQAWRDEHNGQAPDQQTMRDWGAEASIELNSDPDGWMTSDVRKIDPVTGAMINLKDLSPEQLLDLRVMPADLDGTVAGRRLRRKTEDMLKDNNVTATEDITQRLAAAIAIDNQQMINLILGK